jgi:hypothetical protein
LRDVKADDRRRKSRSRKPKPAFDALDFLAREGVVLASGKGPVPSLAEALAGEPIRGSWWAHPRSHEIFDALTAVSDSPDVLCFRLVAGKLTFVHRRLWPALVRLSDELSQEQLTVIRQEHTETGEHRNVLTPFPKWVDARTLKAANALSKEDARVALGDWRRAAKPPKRRS